MDLINSSTQKNAFQPVPQEQRTMAMLLWLLNIFTGLIGPLIIWLIKKDESPFINQQGKNYWNYVISYFIYGIAATLLCFILIGFLILPILVIASTVYSIIAIVKTNQGEDYEVPLSIRFIK